MRAMWKRLEPQRRVGSRRPSHPWQDLSLERRTTDPDGRVTVERAVVRQVRPVDCLLEAWSLPWKATQALGTLACGTVAIAVLTIGRLAMAVVGAVVLMVGAACWLALGVGIIWLAGHYGGGRGVAVAAILVLSGTATLGHSLARDTH